MVLGIVVLGATLIDVFLTALNYDESGFIAGPLTALQWKVLRAGTRRLNRRWRPTALRQVTGLQIMASVVTWIGGTILGYGLIYYGSMHGDNFVYSGAHAGIFAALYFSAAQLATVGTSQLTPNTEVLSALSVAETLTGVILVSLILTFLLGVYDVISSLRSLCSQFYSSERGAGDPISSLEPFFPQGQPTGLDGHLEAISDSLGSYSDGLRLHHAAYYFQSGRDQFSLPYALRMLSGVVAALRWGVPAGRLDSLQPDLVPLTTQLNQFGDYIHPLLQWKSTDVPALPDAQTFERAWRAAPGSPESDPWVSRFKQLNADMAHLTRTDLDDNLQEAYARFTQWLPFTYRTHHLIRAVSRDLDYQPIVVMSGPSQRDEALALSAASMSAASPPPTGPTTSASGTAPSGTAPSPTAPEPTPSLTVPVVAAPEEFPSMEVEGVDIAASTTSANTTDSPIAGSWQGWRNFLRDRATLVDPGFTRLLAALRALFAAAFAGLTVLVLLRSFDTDLSRAAIFGGMIAIFSSAISSRGAGTGRRTTALLAVLPVTVAILLTGTLGTSPVVVVVAMVVISLAGTWMARFGPRWGAMGQLLFITFYFALLMNMRSGELLPHVIAGVVGVLWAFLFAFVLIPDRPGRVARDGVAAFEQRLIVTMDPLIDAVSSARWDPDLATRTHRDMLQFHRSAAFLNGQLTATNTTLGLTPTQASALRLRVFDLELAAVMLVDAAREATGEGMPMTLRARLAGELELLQEHLRTYSRSPRWVRGAPAPDQMPVPVKQAPTERLLAYPAPTEWPEPARRLHRTVRELLRAADALNTVHAFDLSGPEDDGTSSDGTSPQPDHAAQTGQTTQAAQTTQATQTAPVAPPAPAKEHGLEPTSRRAVQAGASTGLALAVGSLVSTTHQYWAAMPAYQVLGGTDGETFVKATRRIIGTIAGAIIGFGIAYEWGSNRAVTVPVLALCVFAGAYFRAVSSPLTTFWQTMLFAQLYELLGRLTTQAVAVRILETIIGAAVALLVARLVLPIHTRNKLTDDVVALVGALSHSTVDSLRRMSGTDVPVATLRARGLAVNRELNKVTGTAAPLRRASGAMELGGIEGMLTAVWSMVYFSRYVLRAATDPRVQTSVVPAQEWERISAITLGNLDALTSAMRGDHPTEIPGRLDVDSDVLDDPTLPRPTQRVLHQLEKLNEAILLLLDNLVPGGIIEAGQSEESVAV